MSSDTKLTKDEECESIDSTKYQGMIGYCLTSWFSKKQTAHAISTTEAEYVSSRKACQQELWMKQALNDYDVQVDNVSIMWDNKGAIDLSKNLVQHSRTKHIEIRYHFLHDNVQKGHISIEKVPLFKHVVSVFPKLAIDRYLSFDRFMHPLAPHYERTTRSDHGKKRPRESNASSFSSTTLNHPSLSHPLDDTLDENDDGSFHSNSSSPFQNISSLSNVVSRVRQNPPHESHNLHTHLSETINLQTQQRDAHREGLRSIGQALKNMMGGKQK
nr:hypothetical protein [Tanacetum cinerariifolium]